MRFRLTASPLGKGMRLDRNSACCPNASDDLAENTGKYQKADSAHVHAKYRPALVEAIEAGCLCPGFVPWRIVQKKGTTEV